MGSRHLHEQVKLEALVSSESRVDSEPTTFASKHGCFIAKPQSEHGGFRVLLYLSPRVEVDLNVHEPHSCFLEGAQAKSYLDLIDIPKKEGIPRLLATGFCPIS